MEVQLGIPYTKKIITSSSNRLFFNFQELTMKKATLLNSYKSHKALADYINSVPEEFRCQLAGRHAFEECVREYLGVGKLREDCYARGDGGNSIFKIPLTVLREEGGVFSESESIEWAKSYADLPSKLKGMR